MGQVCSVYLLPPTVLVFVEAPSWSQRFLLQSRKLSLRKLARAEITAGKGPVRTQTLTVGTELLPTVPGIPWAKLWFVLINLGWWTFKWMASSFFAVINKAAISSLVATSASTCPNLQIGLIPGYEISELKGMNIKILTHSAKLKEFLD